MIWRFCVFGFVFACVCVSVCECVCVCVFGCVSLCKRVFGMMIWTFICDFEYCCVFC